MNSEWLDIQRFKLVPKESLPNNVSRDQVLEIANSFSDFEHAIGTAKYLSELKDVNAGDYWLHEIQFTCSSYITEFERQFLKKTGAVVIYTDLRELVMYHNDVFSNAPLECKIKSNNEITEVNFSLSSLMNL